MVPIGVLDHKHLQSRKQRSSFLSILSSGLKTLCFHEDTLTLVTHIWLVVRVPVLSEQMTEVQPRVSTEGRLLTMAFFLAIRRVPRARQVVMTAGRPEIC